MSEVAEIQPGAETPVLEMPAVPESPELRYEYQPMDDHGRPVGGRQVIKYRTAQELGDKLAEQNKLLILKLREETRKNRLGIVEDETIPEEAPRFDSVVEFTPRELSADERFKLSRDLVDADRFESARELLFESSIGIKPRELAKIVGKLQQDNIAIQAKLEADKFTAANPDYIKCDENFKTLTNWMIRYKLAPVQENFQRAYDHLKKEGLLVLTVQNEPEAVVEIVPAEEVPAPAPVTVADPAPASPVSAPPEPVYTPLSTGLNNNNSETAGPVHLPGDDIVYEIEVQVGKDRKVKRRFTGLAAVNAMPADEYLRRARTDPTFEAKVQALEKDRAMRRQQR